MAQLPLALRLADHASLDTFVAGRGEAALRHVRSVALGAVDTLWLWGAPATGKTHLLQAACRAASAAGRRAMYVGLTSTTPELLADLDRVELLALDDVDRVAGDADWQRPLFGVLNAFLGAGSLLLAGRTAPAKCSWQLPDLASRAAGAVTYRLDVLDDTERARALTLHAAARGLELESAAADYLIKRVARDMAALTGWLDRLDRASLSEQRRLTIPFIRERLGGERPSAE